MPNETMSLGELEGPVLEELWKQGEMSTPAVYEAIGKPRGLAYTTILTVLQWLNKKGLANRRADGRGHIYSPAVSREEFSRLRGRALAVSLGPLGEAGIAGFLSEVERADPEMIELLKTKLAGRA